MARRVFHANGWFLDSRFLVLMYETKDPTNACNYWLLTVINPIFTKLVLHRIRSNMEHTRTAGQHEGIKGTTTTALASQVHRLIAKNCYLAFLDVAKAFPSVPRSLLPFLLSVSGARAGLVNTVANMYGPTIADTQAQGKKLQISTALAAKGCLLSPHLFIYCYPHAGANGEQTTSALGLHFN